MFLSTCGKNESEVPKELVTFLKYVREDLEGSEKEFHDPYVCHLQKFVRHIKESREMEERFMIFEEMLKEEHTAGFAEGHTAGLAEGRTVGLEEGRTEGRIIECKETLLLFLQNLGTVSKKLRDRIQTQQDFEVLKKWTQIAFQSKSLEEFIEKMN